MRRREFITLLCGATAATPLTARAQQRGIPVIGVLFSRGPSDTPRLLAAFRQGLKDTGFIEGQNVAVEYRFASNQHERLPALAADLVQRQVSVLAALTTASALAATAATTTVPIVFESATDPVGLGLVASLNRPGGNVTGITNLNLEIAPKRLELLHELLPATKVIALLVNPAYPPIAEPQLRSTVSAAQTFGLELPVLNASTERDFDGVFAQLVQLQAGGLVIASDTFFTARSEQLGTLAASHRIAAVYDNREFIAGGGLISYGGSLTESYRVAGVYTGRVLKGEKPSELPVQQSTKVEMFLNLKAAKALGITVPLPLLGRADEVIE